MIMQIYKGNKFIAVMTNATVIPRVGETIKISSKTAFKVTDVIWHISEERSWIEVQIK